MTVRRRRAAITTFAGSTATTLVASIQALVLIPLYLHYLGPTLYGAWLASGDLLVFMLAFDMGIPNLIIQRIGAALAQRDSRAIGAYFGTGIVVLSSFAVLLGAALFAISAWVPVWMRLHGQEAEALRGAFLLGAAAICTMLVNYAFQGLARGLQETTVVNVAALLGVILGFGVTFAMLISGFGVWSIAAGLAVRSGTVLLGSLGFLFLGVDRSIRRHIRVDRETGREFWRISPPLFIAGLGYTLMNDSQVLLAATVLGPEIAAVFAITRKAADMAGTILDAVGQGSYGGFSHLFAAGDGVRSRAVYREIVAVYLSLGIAFMCAYMAVNPSLVTVWAGAKMFGGGGLTICLALATLITGWSYLGVSLYRSTDHHKAASAILLIECACRIPLMYGLILWLGLPGLPIGAIATAILSGAWSHSRISRLLPARGMGEPARAWSGRVAVFALGVALCIFGSRPSWSFVILVGAGMIALSGFVFLSLDPVLGRVRAMLGRRLAGARP